jgi:hypothetical protein
VSALNPTCDAIPIASSRMTALVCAPLVTAQESYDRAFLSTG